MPTHDNRVTQHTSDPLQMVLRATHFPTDRSFLTHLVVTLVGVLERTQSNTLIYYIVSK